MRADEAPLRIEYFHGASDEVLRRLGVERALLPDRTRWQAAFEAELARPLAARSVLAVVWELDGEVVGFSTADRIRPGHEARMHLHVVDPDRRRQGLGTRFVGLSAEYYAVHLRLERLICEPNALNAAPNRTLQRAGFRYVGSRHTVPGPINGPQVVTRWVLEPVPRSAGARGRP